MKWMESIKVQSASRREQITEHELMLLACDIRNNPDSQGLREVTVSSHATVPGCFALLLFWDTDDLRPGGSGASVHVRGLERVRFDDSKL